MQKKTELELWLRCAYLPYVGYKNLCKLLHHFGSIAKILSANTNELSLVVNKNIVHSIINIDNSTQVENSIKWLSSESHRAIITLEDERYPQLLKNISSPPLVLFAEGNINLLHMSKMAIVGTRHPTVQGGENAKYFASKLSSYGYVVVSGLANGIDSFAHFGTLENNGNTIAVLGTGIDLCYPKNNHVLFKRIKKSGLILSEFMLGTPPLMTNFPRRNRIVVGLCLGCLVIESGIDGGSMISANLAVEMGREVFAIPGSIYNPAVKGCHKLIKGGAKLVECIEDIIEELPLQSDKPINNTTENAIDVTIMIDAYKIMQLLSYDIIHVDAICTKLNLPLNEVYNNLLTLELGNLIINCGNGYYQKINKGL